MSARGAVQAFDTVHVPLRSVDSWTQQHSCWWHTAEAHWRSWPEKTTFLPSRQTCRNAQIYFVVCKKPKVRFCAEMFCQLGLGHFARTVKCFPLWVSTSLMHGFGHLGARIDNQWKSQTCTRRHILCPCTGCEQAAKLRKQKHAQLRPVPNWRAKLLWLCIWDLSSAECPLTRKVQLSTSRPGSTRFLSVRQTSMFLDYFLFYHLAMCLFSSFSPHTTHQLFHLFLSSAVLGVPGFRSLWLGWHWVEDRSVRQTEKRKQNSPKQLDFPQGAPFGRQSQKLPLELRYMR